MRSLVVYFSKYGHTRRVAQAITESLAPGGPVRLMDAGELSVAALGQAELVVMGSPTHRMNLPEHVREALAALPRKALRGKIIAAFDTSYKMNAVLNRFTAGKRLDRMLRRLGGKRLLRPETFIVTGREGPLGTGELERASAWGAGLLAQTAR